MPSRSKKEIEKLFKFCLAVSDGSARYFLTSMNFLASKSAIDNIFKPIKEEEEPIRKYVNPEEFDYGEKVNEKILDMPVVDAYITLFISFIFIGISIFIIYMIIKLFKF